MALETVAKESQITHTDSLCKARNQLYDTLSVLRALYDRVEGTPTPIKAGQDAQAAVNHLAGVTNDIRSVADQLISAANNLANTI